MSQYLGAEPNLPVDCPRVGIEQQLGRVVPQPLSRVERSADAEAVRLAGAHSWYEPVPDVAVTFRQRQMCLAAVAVEQA